MWNGIGYCGTAWGGGIFMGLIFLLIIGLIVWAILATNRRTGNQEIHRGNSALEIASQRYARGEIGKEEFEQIKKNVV